MWGATDRAWYRDVRAWAIVAALCVIALLDVLIPALGLRTFLLVPVVASIAFGRTRWTAGFGALAVVLYLVVGAALPGDSVLFVRRLAVLVVTCVIAVICARIVERDRMGLAEDARRLQILAENSTDVVFRGSNDGVVEWISPQSEKIVGWAPDELIGRRIVDFVHPDDVSTLTGAQADLREGGAASRRVRLRTSAGDYRWIAFTATPILADDGTVMGRVGGWTDVQDVVAAREEAEAQRSRIKAMLDSQLDPFIHFTTVRDETGRVVDLRFAEANDAAFAYNRSTPEDMLGHTFLEFFPGLMEHGPMAQYIRCAETGEPVILDDYAYPNEILHDDRRYDIRAVRTLDGMALTWRDVTERHRSVERLADSERRYRLLAENATDVIWQVAPDGRVEWASESTTPVLGWPIDQVVGADALGFIHPDDQAVAVDARARVVGGAEIREEYRVRRADGEYRWIAFAVRGLPTPEGVTRIVTMHDIDAEVHARDALARIAGRDPLTGLMTREEMERRIREVMRDQASGRVAVLCVGVDSLSAVNEAYTHAVGDVVIATTAARIAQEVGHADNLARGAGVDFIVLVPGEDDVADVATLAERIRSAAKGEIVVGSHRIRPTVSIGIATRQMTEDPEHLVRAATLAMRRAKDGGRDRVAFATVELAEEAERRLTLASRIAQGLSQHEFTAWFQPITDLVNGEVRGYEALARWVPDDGAVVEPAGFMPVLESTPMIAHVDAVALERSLAVARACQATTFFSVNVSARSLSSDAYPTWLLETVRESGVPPHLIHLEVTETALLDVSREVVGRMQTIADAGVSWYVDDFGTGYSSISHLRDLPVRGLKLDLSFTAGIGRGDTRSIQLAQALAGMAHGLGLDTVAEGVETQEQAAVLSAQGWRHGQGWLYGRAAPLDA